jgi:hypothetical protein
MKFDLINHLERQIAFSTKAFGPGYRLNGILDHIKSELMEIEEAPTDLEEWIDVVILAMDGAWRSGHTPEEIAEMLNKKLIKNENRNWPDWRTSDPDKAITHIKD